MCTTMIITKGACADGAMRVTHSDDNELSDQRLIYVPAMDHDSGVSRDVVAGTNDAYPRLVSDQRGPNYEMEGYPITPAIGKIPQVDHTYAYDAGTSVISTITSAHNSTSFAVETRHVALNGQLTGIETKNGGGTILSRHGYLYDRASRRTRATREDGAYWSYKYNDKGEDMVLQ